MRSRGANPPQFLATSLLATGVNSSCRRGGIFWCRLTLRVYPNGLKKPFDKPGLGSPERLRATAYWDRLLGLEQEAAVDYFPDQVFRKKSTAFGGAVQPSEV
ncbi:protein of unknown function [Methylocaldum szegediense]|uniref:Uncharacterized protein n=1 Tax=Methylocaldum szegediense TaxID=73780 RepID=A0ABM9HXY5_9GAMM|nr:protein of unknown function [Methylocaldum szegediense]